MYKSDKGILQSGGYDTGGIGHVVEVPLAVSHIHQDIRSTIASSINDLVGA